MKKTILIAMVSLLALGCTKKSVEVTLAHDITVECPASESMCAFKVMYINAAEETDLSGLDSYIKDGKPDVLMAICPAGYDATWAKGLGFEDATASTGSGVAAIVAGPAFESRCGNSFYAGALIGTTTFVAASLSGTPAGSLADAKTLVSEVRTDACILTVDAKYPSRADLRYGMDPTGRNFDATDWFSSHALIDCVAGWNTCYQPSGIDGERTSFLYCTPSRWGGMAESETDMESGFKVYPMSFTLNVYEEE